MHWHMQIGSFEIQWHHLPISMHTQRDTGQNSHTELENLRVLQIRSIEIENMGLEPTAFPGYEMVPGPAGALCVEHPPPPPLGNWLSLRLSMVPTWTFHTPIT